MPVYCMEITSSLDLAGTQGQLLALPVVPLLGVPGLADGEDGSAGGGALDELGYLVLQVGVVHGPVHEQVLAPVVQQHHHAPAQVAGDLVELQESQQVVRQPE